MVNGCTFSQIHKMGFEGRKPTKLSFLTRYDLLINLVGLVPPQKGVATTRHTSIFLMGNFHVFKFMVSSKYSSPSLHLANVGWQSLASSLNLKRKL